MTHPTATLTASGNVILQRAAQDGVVPDTLVLTPADVKAISEALGKTLERDLAELVRATE